MEILVAATITPTDDGAALALTEHDLDDGHYRITFVGDSAVISADRPGLRHRRVDRLTQASRTLLKGGKIAFEGISDQLVAVVGVPPEKAHVSFKAKGIDGCPSCH